MKLKLGQETEWVYSTNCGTDIGPMFMKWDGNKKLEHLTTAERYTSTN